MPANHLQISLQARCLGFYLVYWPCFERGKVLLSSSADVQFEGAVGAVAGSGEEESVEGEDMLPVHILIMVGWK